MNEERVLSFSTEFSHRRLLLIELSEETADEIRRGGELEIKGDLDEEAVFVSSSATFAVKQAETSNSLLLLNPNNLVQISLDSYLELTRIPPRIAKLRKLLKQAPYDGTFSSLNAPNLYSFSQLREVIQTSDVELEDALHKERALQIAGYWRLLEPSFEYEVMDTIIAAAAEHDWDLQSLSEVSCIRIISELQSEVISHCLRKYGTDLGNQVYRLLPEIVCPIFAHRLFATKTKWAFDSFMSSWEEKCPPGMYPTVLMLNGIAIIEQQAYGRHLRYLSVSNLDDAPAVRFRQLFQFREQWKLQDILPYVKDVSETAGITEEQMILKYARAVQSADGDKYYCSRE